MFDQVRLHILEHRNHAIYMYQSVSVCAMKCVKTLRNRTCKMYELIVIGSSKYMTNRDHDDAKEVNMATCVPNTQNVTLSRQNGG